MGGCKGINLVKMDDVQWETHMVKNCFGVLVKTQMHIDNVKTMQTATGHDSLKNEWYQGAKYVRNPSAMGVSCG